MMNKDFIKAYNELKTVLDSNSAEDIYSKLENLNNGKLDDLYIRQWVEKLNSIKGNVEYVASN